MYGSSQTKWKSIRICKEQSLEICMEAVKQNGFAFRYVKDQTPEICIEAVKQNVVALNMLKIKQ